MFHILNSHYLTLIIEYYHLSNLIIFWSSNPNAFEKDCNLNVQDIFKHIFVKIVN